MVICILFYTILFLEIKNMLKILKELKNNFNFDIKKSYNFFDYISNYSKT